MEKSDIFNLMLSRVIETAETSIIKEPQAFARWFANLYFNKPSDIFHSDGSNDGKVDSFFNTNDGKNVVHYVLNTKYTNQYNKIAPVTFYEEITYLCRVYENKEERTNYLNKEVKRELREKYAKLLEYYDAGNAKLMFVTNCKRNENHIHQVKKLPIEIFHLEELIEYIVDDIDGAMPRTSPLMLNGIQTVLSPDTNDTEVPTSIVFARLLDFINYSKNDQYDLLFSRNIRLDLGNTIVNKSIRKTFEDSPKEFAFSNNGITLLCEKHTHDPGTKELTIINPRVVNGSQTLHSVRNVEKPSENARVMLRIIEIPSREQDLPAQIKRKKDIINKISLRSNQQNYIKSWNLVANDKFQLDLYRFLRKKGYFYERREKEYNGRSRELKSVKIKKGPSLKRMGQLIACYNYENSKLGPAMARNPSKLFTETNYEIISKSIPELGYNLFLLDEIISKHLNELTNSKKYIQQYKGYIQQSLISLVIKVLKQSKIKLVDSSFSILLEQYIKTEDDYPTLKKLVKNCIDFIHNHYIKHSKSFLRKEGYDLTIANYFKSNHYMKLLLKQPLSFPYKRFSNTLFKIKK